MKKIPIMILLCMSGLTIFAQKEWSNWYYNGNSLLTFKNGYPQVVQGFTTPPPAPGNFFHFSNWGSGGISYSDSLTGEMKFIISNRVGFGSNYTDFPNPNFIRSCPDKFSYHILPFNDHSNRHYVIQFQDFYADLLAAQSGLQVRCPNAVNLAYSIVDLNLNGGLGDFSSINNVLSGPLTGQITTVRHANGKDAWIIVHPYATGNYHAYLATDNGIQSPVSSTVGPVLAASAGGIIGTLTASHDGKTLAASSGEYKAIHLFNFDNATGIISSFRSFPALQSPFRLQFSPDNSKLYGLVGDGLYQWDFNESNFAASATKLNGEIPAIIYDMQLAPDGKIYVTKTAAIDSSGAYNEYTGAIQCPNLPKYAANFNPTALNSIWVAFPDLINDFINSAPAAPPPLFSLGNDTTICFGSYTITAPAGWESYRWNTGDTSRQLTVAKAGLYYVLTGNTGFSCPSGYGYINIADKAIKLNLGKDTTLCPRSSFLLHIDNAYTNITWQNGSHTRDSLFTTSSNIIVSANDVNGCYSRDTMSVNFRTETRAEFGADTTLCNNSSLVLKLHPQTNPFYSGVYQWSDGTTLDKITVSQPGTYWGRVSYQGCTVSDTIQLDYINATRVYLGKDTVACQGDSIWLQSNITNGIYLWNTGATTRGIYTSSSGNYSVTVQAGTCSFSDTIRVTFNSLPVFPLGNDSTLCENQSMVLSPATGGGSFLWQDGSVNASFRVNIPGSYWLRVTRNGCSYSDSINISYTALPSLNLGADTTICNGQTLLLNAAGTGITQFLWQDRSTQSSFRTDKAGIYFVQVTGSNGCINKDSIGVSVTLPPLFTLGADTVLCSNSSLSYNFNIANASYLWSNGSTKSNYSIAAPGTYSLRVSLAGCAASDSINIMYKPLPIVALGNDSLLCEGNTLRLNAFNTGATYQWQDNSTLSFYTVTAPGLYEATVDLNGCKKSGAILITYKKAPVVFLGNDTVLCNGGQLRLKPFLNSAANYLWQDGSILPQFDVIDSGLYRLTVSNECGSFSDEINVTGMICMLQMPTAFSPNKDGLNDVFRVKYPFAVKQFSMNIFNQWGQKIFESADITRGWDGTFRGNSLPINSYVWVIQLTGDDGKIQQASGTVTLIR